MFFSYPIHESIRVWLETGTSWKRDPKKFREGEGVPKAMTVAGSDSGGGAGIQADLKTFAALRVYGTSVVTAITAQNTTAVHGIHEVPLDMIASQMDAVIAAIGVDSVKTGMLASRPIIETVSNRLADYDLDSIVVDPVMISKSGACLLKEDALEALKTKLLPLAAVVTPNIPEAEILSGMRIESKSDARQAARLISNLGPRAVVVKGGHLSGAPMDLLYENAEFTEYEGTRVDTRNTHGTGCTFSSAIAAGLAHGFELKETVAMAKEYVTGAMKTAFPVGLGHGPLNHLHYFWR